MTLRFDAINTLQSLGDLGFGRRLLLGYAIFMGLQPADLPTDTNVQATSRDERNNSDAAPIDSHRLGGVGRARTTAFGGLRAAGALTITWSNHPSLHLIGAASILEKTIAKASRSPHAMNYEVHMPGRYIFETGLPA